MRKVVEKTAATYEEAAKLALEALGLPEDAVAVALVQTRDTDSRRPGPEEYTVRAWEKDAPGDADAEPELNVSPLDMIVCQKTGATFEEAKSAGLATLGITEDQADISIIQREDTNPLRPGPERVTVRVWRKAPEETR